MHYFIEIYDKSSNHVGTRSLRAVTEGGAKSEARAILATLPPDHVIRLFVQPERENYSLIATLPR